MSNNDLTDVIDKCAGAACGLLTLNMWLQSVNLIVAIIAGLCAIAWFGVRFYDRFTHKDLRRTIKEIE